MKKFSCAGNGRFLAMGFGLILVKLNSVCVHQYWSAHYMLSFVIYPVLNLDEIRHVVVSSTINRRRKESMSHTEVFCFLHKSKSFFNLLATANINSSVVTYASLLVFPKISARSLVMIASLSTVFNVACSKISPN